MLEEAVPAGPGALPAGLGRVKGPFLFNLFSHTNTIKTHHFFNDSPLMDVCMSIVFKYYVKGAIFVIQIL